MVQVKKVHGCIQSLNYNPSHQLRLQRLWTKENGYKTVNKNITKA